MDAGTAGRRRTRESPDVRRDQILDAATGVFLERGVSVATMDDVAGAAGVAKGTIYLYHPSKESLIAAVQAKLLDRVVTRARRSLETSEGGSQELLDRFVAGVVDDMLDYAEVQHLALHEAPRHGSLEEVYGLVTGFVQRGVNSGEFHVVDPELVSWFLVDGLLGLVAQATHEPRPGRRAVRSAALESAHRILAVTDSSSAPELLTNGQ